MTDQRLKATERCIIQQQDREKTQAHAMPKLIATVE